MPDLDVVAVLKAAPGAEGTLRDALDSIVAPTRDEPGCLSYSLYESAVESGTFVTVEKWRQQSDLDAHMQTSHVTSALQAVGDGFAEPPAIHVLIPRDVQ